jgi:large subunit ribosomal protein MRP49
MVPQVPIAVNGQPIAQAQLDAADFYEWQPIEISCPPQPEARSAQLRIGDALLGPPTTTLGDATWRWRWNPQHAVGRFAATLTLTLAGGATAELPFDLRVVPRKLDIERYEALIQAVQRDAVAIVYALSGGREGATLQRQPEMTPPSLVEEYYTLVERHVADAVALTRQIAGRPHQSLTRQPATISLAEAERLDVPALADLARGPLDDVAADVAPSLQSALRPAERTEGGPLPRTLRAQRAAGSVDVVEHRLLKSVLQTLLWRAGFVRSLVRRELQRRQRNAQLIEGLAIAPLEQWQARTQAAQRSLRQCLAQPWLESVGSLGAQRLAGPTHLMRHDPRYRRLYALYRALHTTPFIALDSSALWLPIQELPALYEQWCALQTLRALLPLGQVVEQQLLSRADNDRSAYEPRWTLRLRQNAPLLVLRLDDGARLALYYQRRYQPQPATSRTLGALDPFVRIPDMAIEVERPSAPPRVLIFDAKYRVAGDGSVPQDALDDAYAYRGAIGSAGARATLGAFLLFPGRKPLSAADQVGALPLLPDRTEDLTTLLRTLLEQA